MKKIILFLVALFIIPINILALDYAATASGNRIFHSKADADKHGFRAYTDLYIDISNIENLDSLTMWVKYDTNLIGLQGCMHLYVADGGCPWYQDSVYFKYTYKEGWHDRLNKYSFYHVTFMPKDSTPTSGTTEVRVEFENAKDKEGNDVYIEPLILEYTFEPLTFKWNGPTQIPEQENNENNADSNINQDDDTNNSNVSKEDIVSIPDVNQNASTNVPNNNTNVIVEEVKKSNNANIKRLNIVGYEIDFNKDIYEYTIEIDKKLEKLDINVETEDEKATLSIEGNSNLSNNDSNLIKIKVTAEDLSESEYLIKTVSKKEQTETNQEIDILEENKENNNQTNDFNEIITYSFMVVVLLVLMIVIIKKYLKNKK